MSKCFQCAVFIWWKTVSLWNMSLNTDVFYQHFSATINRVWLYYQHPIKTTPCRNPATTSQTTPIFLPINFQNNPTPTTWHTSTNPLKYAIPLHYPHIPHTRNKLHVRVVQQRPNIRSHSVLFTNYNIHDKVYFLFNNTDSHIIRLTANFVFQAFQRRKKHN